jgi:hypothetical protein
MFRRGYHQRPPTYTCYRLPSTAAAIRASICAGFVVQCLDEVGDQLGAVFEADRQTQQGVADTHRGARGGAVGHLGKMLDQRFHAAQRHCEGEHPGAFTHPGGCVGAASQLRRHHATETTRHLLGGQQVIGMAGQPRVMHPPYGRVCGEEFGDPLHAIRGKTRTPELKAAPLDRRRVRRRLVV